MSYWIECFLCPGCKEEVDEWARACPYCGYRSRSMNWLWKTNASKKWIDTSPPRKWYQFWIKKTGHWEYKK